MPLILVTDADPGESRWSTEAAAGLVTNGANVGAGEDIFRDKTTSILNFKTLVAGSGVTLTPAADDVTIAVSVINVVAPFTFATASPMTVAALLAGYIVEWAQIVITTTFDDLASTLQLGITATPNAIFTTTESEPSTAATYSTHEPLVIAAPTNLILTITPGASTQGVGYVLAGIRPV